MLHKLQYKLNCSSMKKADDDFSAIDTITEELMKKKIDCVKYNYNLDPSV